VLVVIAGAPGPVSARNIVAQIHFGQAVQKFVPVAALAGKRIAQAGFLEQHVRIKPGPLPANCRKFQRRVPVDRPRLGLGDVADSLTIADGDDVHPVLDVAIDQDQLGRSPFAQPLVGLGGQRPVLLRPQIGVRGILVAVVKRDIGEEIVEIELQHVALQFHGQIEPGIGFPG